MWHTYGWVWVTNAAADRMIAAAVRPTLEVIQLSVPPSSVHDTTVEIWMDQGSWYFESQGAHFISTCDSRHLPLWAR